MVDERDAEVDSIDDAFIRRFVRMNLHVRTYAPYYAVTAILLAVVLFASGHPGTGGSNQLVPAASSGAATATAAGTPAARGGAGSPASGALPAGDAALAAADIAFAGGTTAAYATDGVADSGIESGSGTPTVPATPATPATTVPDVPSSSGSAVCTIAAPSPAPNVAPSREVANAQNTAEAAAGQSVPVDGGSTVETALQTAGCPGGTTANSAITPITPAVAVAAPATAATPALELAPAAESVVRQAI